MRVLSERDSHMTLRRGRWSLVVGESRWCRARGRGDGTGAGHRGAHRALHDGRGRSDAAALGRTGAVVRLGGDVLDRADLEAGRGQRTDRGLAARARALHEDVDLLQAVLLSPARGGLGGHLRGERGGLARALEADLARGGPGDHGTGRIGDRHDGVVEGALDERLPVDDVLLVLAARLARGRLAGLGCHAAELLWWYLVRRIPQRRESRCGSATESGPARRRRGARISGSSSCPRRCAWGPCEYVRWSWCAARAPAGRGDAAGPRSCRSPPCGGCRPDRKSVVSG